MQTRSLSIPSPYMNNLTHYVTKSMWTLERLSIRIGNLATGICSHSARRALVRSGTDVEQYSLGHSWHSSSSQKSVDGIKVLDLCRPVKFFQTKFKIPISVWSWFQVRWYCDVETGKGLPQTVATKLMPVCFFYHSPSNHASFLAPLHYARFVCCHC